MQFGEVNISAIIFDPKSRDDNPQILRELQYIYTKKSVRDRVYAAKAPCRLIQTITLLASAGFGAEHQL